MSEYNEGDIRYSCTTNLNCTLSFLRFLILFGRLLAGFRAEQKTPLCKHRRSAVGKYNWLLLLVSNPFTDKFENFSDHLLQMSSKKRYTDMIQVKCLAPWTNFYMRILAPNPDTILSILFCNVNRLNTLFEFPQNFTPYLIIEWKYANYTIHRTSVFKMWNNLLTAKHAALILGTIWSICFSQFKRLSICIPKDFVLIISTMSLFAYSIVNGANNKFIGVNFAILFFSN